MPHLGSRRNSDDNFRVLQLFRKAHSAYMWQGLCPSLLRSELFGLRKDIAEIPDRLAKAKLDSLVYGVGDPTGIPTIPRSFTRCPRETV